MWKLRNFSSNFIEINSQEANKQSTGTGLENGHYDDVIMGMMASQITSLTIVYSTVYSDADQRKHQSSASLAFVRGIHRGPVNSPHKWPVTRKMFPFHDVIMAWRRRSMIGSKDGLDYGNWNGSLDLDAKSPCGWHLGPTYPSLVVTWWPEPIFTSLEFINKFTFGRVTVTTFY